MHRGFFLFFSACIEDFLTRNMYIYVIPHIYTHTQVTGSAPALATTSAPAPTRGRPRMRLPSPPPVFPFFFIYGGMLDLGSSFGFFWGGEGPSFAFVCILGRREFF